ncbi:MAG: alcohol dehydrogenase catalytic domain-containing protein [Clostridia bacterium]|nr:alcohol dehydrogenase catalytic domain-containing protein [Clostridia bacterium]
MEKKAVILNNIGSIEYKELKDEYIYKPTLQEEIDHGTKVYALQNGEVGDDQIEVEAVLGSICTHEVSLYKGDLTHPRYPMVPGHEAVHRVVKVGKNVTHLKPGDYAACCWYMGQWSRKLIGPAEYAFKLPDNIDDPANWVIEPAASIVNAASYMNILPGDRVLLVGAGFMGLLMIQLIKGYPMSEFVICDVKESSRELAKRVCGNGKVIHPDEVEGEFEKVIECSGSQSGLDLAVKANGMAGEIYLFGWHRHQRTIDFKTQHLKGTRLIHTSPAIDSEKEYSRYWPRTIKLFEAGVFDLKPLISHKYMACDIARAMEDSVKREEGFVKSVFYLEDWKKEK